MAAGNEFSDHAFEKRNYLNLAGSKLRTCSIGPEIVIDPDFGSVPGEVRIERGPLRGIEGTLLREGSCLRLVLAVELLQRSLAVEVDPEIIGPPFN